MRERPRSTPSRHDRRSQEDHVRSDRRQSWTKHEVKSRQEPPRPRSRRRLPATAPVQPPWPWRHFSAYRRDAGCPGSRPVAHGPSRHSIRSPVEAACNRPRSVRSRSCRQGTTPPPPPPYTDSPKVDPPPAPTPKVVTKIGITVVSPTVIGLPATPLPRIFSNSSRVATMKPLTGSVMKGKACIKNSNHHG